MDVDDFLQEKRAAEAKERLEDAKRKLKEEKERLFEEQKKLKESRHQRPEAVDRSSGPSSTGLKPWMLWDLIILGVVLVLFIVAMFVPRDSSDTLVQKATDDKIAALELQIADLKANMTVKQQPVKATPVNTTKKTIVDDDLLDSSVPVPLIDFKVQILDLAGNSAGEIEGNGSEIKYVLLIENPGKKEHEVCKIDRVKDGEETKDYASNVIVKKGEKDTTTYTVTDKGTTNFIYRVRCAFADYDESNKMQAISSFSSNVDVKLKTILN